MHQVVEAIAYHGWGFDHSCWQSWQTAFERQDIGLQGFDRGYFGQPVAPTFSHSSSYKLILTHSYGLHLCPLEYLQQADLIVSFSGFQSFHPGPSTPRRRSQLTLQQMIRQFEHSPSSVLEAFYATCYHPVTQEGPVLESLQEQMHRLNADLLLQDLQALDTALLDAARFNTKSKILIIQGTSDRITPPDRAQALSQQLPTSRYIEIPLAGHALPITHWAEAWRSLAPLLPGVVTA